MTRTHRTLVLYFTLAVLALPSSAQVPTGTPPFGSFGGGPDIINLANLNSHLAIPVLHKSGRGTDFTYDLSYDSSVWYPVGSSGNQTWLPVANWGWQGSNPAGSSFVAYSMSYISGTCWNGAPAPYQEWLFSNFVYHDSFGMNHAFSYNPVYFQSPGGTNCPPNGALPPTVQPQLASDGSG